MLCGFNITPAWWLLNQRAITDELEAARNAHAKIVRTHIPIAAWMSPSGKYNRRYLLELGTLLMRAKRRGLGVILCISGETPDPASYAKAVGQIAGMFHSQVSAIELWNEPNNPNYFAGTAAEYVALAQVAYKAVGGRTYVIAPALANADTAWLSDAYEAGLKGCMDALSCHPYSVRFVGGIPQWAAPLAADTIGGPGWVNSIITCMNTYKDDSPVWVTEFGYPVCSSYLGAVTLQKQKEWLAAAVEGFAETPRVKTLTLYKLRDDSPTDGFGLIASSGVKRPAYTSVSDEYADQ